MLSDIGGGGGTCSSVCINVKQMWRGIWKLTRRGGNHVQHSLSFWWAYIVFKFMWIPGDSNNLPAFGREWFVCLSTCCLRIRRIKHHHPKHQGSDPLIGSVSTVTAARANASSIFQLFSFLVVCSGMISKGFGFVDQSCAFSADSELGRVSSGWITSPSLSNFGGS